VPETGKLGDALFVVLEIYIRNAPISVIQIKWEALVAGITAITSQFVSNCIL